MRNKRIAVVVAGGSGSRMGMSTPKQFLLLKDKPVLMHTLERFKSCDELILVLPEAEIPSWQSLVSIHGFRLKHTIVPGGPTRFQSVRNGLMKINLEGIVAVHDGVRPIVTDDLITRCYEQAEKSGTAIPCISIPDSIREARPEGYAAADRSRFVLVQTPQCFHSRLIRQAYEVEERTAFTDDASVMESAGIPLNFIEGERWNIKITYKDDLRVAAAFL